MKKLAGKVALITGGNSGIGLATAKEFVEQGAQVIITGRRQDVVDAAVKEIGTNSIGIQGDVANLADLDRMYGEIKKKFGKIDILFANAAVVSWAPFDSVSEAHFDREFDINVKGLFFTVQKALPLLSQGATILLTGSVAGIKGFAGSAVYSATKAAIRSFARTWTLELKDRGIRVNVLSPGPIETPIFNKTGMSQAELEEFTTNIATQVPQGRIGQPSETAKAALFLVSDDSSYVSGIDLYVDGGLAQV